MTYRLTGLATFVAIAAFTFATPARAQQDYQSGDVTNQVESTAAYGDAEAAAVENPYATGEGGSEWQSNTFDGSSSTGSYQDTETLDPSYGNGAYSNSDE